MGQEYNGATTLVTVPPEHTFSPSTNDMGMLHEDLRSQDFCHARAEFVVLLPAFYTCGKWSELRGSANHWNWFGAGGHLQDILRIHIEKHKYIWFSKYIMSLGSMCIFANLWVYLSFSLRSLLGWTRSCSRLYCIEFFTIFFFFHYFLLLKLLPFLRLLEDICGCFSLPWPIFLMPFFFLYSFYSTT